ncbi:hypothetical protein B0A69_16815 [Chryseobacterium shigense]|nr:hypothetical protein B0A69_16815 [Chryseobacterium shigense]
MRWLFCYGDYRWCIIKKAGLQSQMKYKLSSNLVSLAVLEQVELIQQLEEKEKNVVYTIIESFISKKKIKEFVQQNVAL